ncbi:MAG: copper amine oxidase N-terminal domain-containing protein [bacterium]|nr:copper amine oxidase N-terminal domain-containing protein [bacterium]
MHRFIIFLVLIMIFVFSESPKKAELIYNDTKLSAYIINNTAYLSKEDLSYILGSPITWNKEERVIIVENMRIYARIAIYKSQLLLAIKDVLPPLGYQIKWDQQTRTVRIIPPSNKNQEYKAKVKIESSKNSEENRDSEENRHNQKSKGKSKDSSTYQIPFIDSGSDKSQKDVKPEQSLQVVFIPRSAWNEEYKVTVSDMKESKIYKGMYNAQIGYKFVIISVSQQNLSNKVQLYTGKFVLFDNRNIRYEYIEGLSSYVLQILMPMGINFGTLVFEVPETSIPSKLVLETYGSTPIVINLL